ncbi:hypothetical protein BROUX41_002045 [Berkeleyomyces rouxiae]
MPRPKSSNRLRAALEGEALYHYNLNHCFSKGPFDAQVLNDLQILVSSKDHPAATRASSSDLATIQPVLKKSRSGHSSDLPFIVALRKHVTITREYVGEHTAQDNFHLPNVEDYLSLKTHDKMSKVSAHLPNYKQLLSKDPSLAREFPALVVSPVSKLRKFMTSFCIEVQPVEPIEGLLSAARSLGTSRLGPSSPGAITPIISLAVSFSPGTVDLTFGLEIRWNVSSSPWLSLRSSKERVASRTLIHAAFPSAAYEDISPEDAIKDVNWADSPNGKSSDSDLNKLLRPIPEPSPNIFSPSQFYEATYMPNENDPSAHAITVPGLAYTLYKYQKRSLKWLLSREGVAWEQRRIVPCVSSHPTLPRTFRKAKDAEGKPFYISDVLQLVTRDLSQWKAADNMAQGGILAEEMGLGKTLEIISLILLHRRYLPVSPSSLGPHLSTKATLIVCPSSLEAQWLDEFKTHAPQLKVTIYEGCQIGTPEEKEAKVGFLASHDVVITTYNICSSEIYYVDDAPERPRRFEKVYDRPKSPLVQLNWWRLCLDEAQMIENGYSQAAKVTRAIPRTFSWGVTSTPFKNQTKDLLGLLSFLNIAPYASHPPAWNSLIGMHHHVFKALVYKICLRHTKAQVAHEIKLPPQRRYVITIPLGKVEKQYYQSLLKEMADACGLSLAGEPLAPDWDLACHEDKMRKWLHTLHQAALYPQVAKNCTRINLSERAETIHHVLEAIVESSDKVRTSKQRLYMTACLYHGQLLDATNKPEEALNIWDPTLETLGAMAQRLRDEVSDAVAADRLLIKSHSTDSSNNDESLVLTEARRSLRATLELYHRTVSSCANACFKIKVSNEDQNRSDPILDERLETLDRKARILRKEMAKDTYSKAWKLIKKVHGKQLVELSDLPFLKRAGMGRTNVTKQPQSIFNSLNKQNHYISEWRAKVVKLILCPLVDEDDGATIDDFEDEATTKLELYSYIMFLWIFISDREDAMTGGTNMIMANEVESARATVSLNQASGSSLLLELMSIRHNVKPSPADGSMRSAMSKLRNLANSSALMSPDDGVEFSVAKAHEEMLGQIITEQEALIAALKVELDLFKEALAARKNFYKHIKTVSDSVREYAGPTSAMTLANAIDYEEIQKDMAKRSERRFQYLLNLQSEICENDTADQDCLICREPFAIGTLTACGHQFCQSCLAEWHRDHRTCPLCQFYLRPSDLHRYTKEPEQPRLHITQSEGSSTNANEAATGQNIIGSSSQAPPQDAIPDASAIYATLDEGTLAEINSVSLNGHSYTAKVSAIVRHLIWLRRTEPYAKSLIYSSYTGFLKELDQALSALSIDHATLGQAGAIARFYEDSQTKVLLLDSRADSAGLNLVCANHVFLCEPLVNTALELQTVARVDRIGQTSETTVWQYLIEGTVEEAAYRLASKHRLEHMPASSGDGQGEEDDGDARMRLEKADRWVVENSKFASLMNKDRNMAEAVHRNDLLACLFGATPGETWMARR